MSFTEKYKLRRRISTANCDNTVTSSNLEDMYSIILISVLTIRAASIDALPFSQDNSSTIIPIENVPKVRIEYDSDVLKGFKKGCENGTIFHIFSEHNTSLNDRRFQYECRKTPYLTGKCIWTEFLNLFRQDLDYICPGDAVISGIGSLHDPEKQDRRWKVRCCYLPCHAKLEHCRWSKPINSPGGTINYRSEWPFYARGVWAKFDPNSKDRKWKLLECKVKRKE